MEFLIWHTWAGDTEVLCNLGGRKSYNRKLCVAMEVKVAYPG